ncbi:hypothetical protein ZYGR_0AV01490 [Zygosaccharomyces rouxii]|uniref:Serine aminopeptidase S33 domain-containing protein n=1 Tax=Zygosaccharomyces rouxii TaxID=4956 RepID=A0A1Q3AIG4_ZYGRO|nr:hypothetical protein ZYGR_0AV01490 [Zygosaccharomyces rouxii]
MPNLRNLFRRSKTTSDMPQTNGYPTSSEFPYPYKPKTEVPAKKFIEFNDATFATLFWPSVSKPKGRVFIVHGFGEYTRLQHRLMDHLALNGYESWTFDQRGAGETSEGKERGRTNEFHVFNDLDHFIELNLKETQEKGIPLILFGHSMGGGITLNYGIHGTHREKIAAYSTTGPLVLLHPHTAPMSAVNLVAPLLATVLPNFQINSGLDVDAIAGDAQYKKFLLHDEPLGMPLIGTLRQIYDFLQRGKKLNENSDGYVTQFIEKPLIIMHGEKDTINDPAATKRFYDASTLQDKQLKLYPDMVHSLLSLENDENFAEVFGDYRGWLDSRFA